MGLASATARSKLGKEAKQGEGDQQANRAKPGEVKTQVLLLLILPRALRLFVVVASVCWTGASGRTRTCNLLIRSQKLYPIELPTPNALANSPLPLAKSNARERA